MRVTHTGIEVGTEVQRLNALVKGDVPLQVVRMAGPDLIIGALAAMAAYPYILLRAAELRQVTNSLTAVFFACWVDDRIQSVS